MVKNEDSISGLQIQGVSLVVLGTVQDGGSPHIGCTKSCCIELFQHPGLQRNVVAMGLIDPENEKTYLFECTPDFPMQAKQLKQIAGFAKNEMPDGIFLTHAHIGHYAGLMYLGKEAINAARVKVYAMPRLQDFLEKNGPWSQLVRMKNIEFRGLNDGQTLELSSNIKVTPLRVPHRDEFSETVGFVIHGPLKKVLFIPDIDKWEKWDQDIIRQIADVDYALIDGTFYDGVEINNRNIREIPHPFITESMKLFQGLSEAEKAKIYFIHLNHTNPALDTASEAFRKINADEFHVAQMNQFIPL